MATVGFPRLLQHRIQIWEEDCCELGVKLFLLSHSDFQVSRSTAPQGSTQCFFPPDNHTPGLTQASSERKESLFLNWYIARQGPCEGFWGREPGKGRLFLPKQCLCRDMPERTVRKTLAGTCPWTHSPWEWGWGHWELPPQHCADRSGLLRTAAPKTDLSILDCCTWQKGGLARETHLPCCKVTCF